MNIVSCLIVSGEIVHLDGNHFVDCTFTECQLIYDGGSVIFERTAFIRCRHIFHGPARATVRYMQEVGLMEIASGWSELSESVN